MIYINLEVGVATATKLSPSHNTWVCNLLSNTLAT